MSHPHGVVIWLLAGVTLAVPSVIAWVLSGRRRKRPSPPVPAARMLPAPVRPEPGEYTGDQPASGAAWAVGPPADDDGGR